MDPCPGAGNVARRQRVRNLATAFLRRTPHGFLTLSLLSLAACANSPPRVRESLPQPTPVAVAAPAASTAATDNPTPAPAAPTPATVAPTAAPQPPPPAPAPPTPPPATPARRSTSLWCRWWKAPSSRTPARAPALRDCGSSFPVRARALA